MGNKKILAGIMALSMVCCMQANLFTASAVYADIPDIQTVDSLKNADNGTVESVTQTSGDWTYELTFTYKQLSRDVEKDEEIVSEYYNEIQSLKSIRLLEYVGEDSDVVVPETIKVTSINDDRWEHSDKLNLEKGIDIVVSSISEYVFLGKTFNSVDIQAGIKNLKNSLSDIQIFLW